MDPIYANKFPMIEFDGETYGSTEHLYQALKSTSTDFQKMIRDEPLPTKTKTLAKKNLKPSSETLSLDNIFTFRSDWDEIKDSVMELCLLLKFTQHEDLKQKLINTGDTYIEERNCWGDIYWGTVNGVGQNKLGLLLMKTRDFINQ
jgi:ribA/ribD-fused uncharacterized protein